jgi:hypothetical protein
MATLLLSLAPTAAAGEFWKPFIAGVASGFAIHEGNHFVLDLAFDAKPRLKGVSFGPIPFFAVTHRSGVPAHEEALISGAGFLSQHITSEVALTRRAPGDEISPFEKGLLAFHVATSVAYAGAAFARYGPYERDTRGIADATRTDERVIGALVLAPAVFDAWRYKRPNSRAAKWGSRLSKGLYLGVIAFKD